MTSAFYALGIRRRRGARTLDVLYTHIGTDSALVSAYLSCSQTGHAVLDTTQIPAVFQGCLARKEDFYSDKDVIAMALPDVSQPIGSVEEAYLKLHLLSGRYAQPHTLCLDHLFGTLENIAWTNKGPILPEDLAQQRLIYAMSESPLVVSHVDKFPYMVNYVVPTGVRVASGSQVRLGAYLGEGTTVMPSGYVNFNAGTEGKAMIEGRVSAGVFVGDASDVGGGASIMGTLSGGNQHVISVGPQCLLGANAGIGISLGRGCTVAAGLYVYSGMKISLENEKGEPVNLAGESVPLGQNVVKARELSGKEYLLFIQDSQTGKVICKPNSKVISLNKALHDN